MNNKDLDKKILELLKESSVGAEFKNMVKGYLDSASQSSKEKIFKILMDEKKKLFKLHKKEERLVEKYSVIMGRLTKKA